MNPKPTSVNIRTLAALMIALALGQFSTAVGQTFVTYQGFLTVHEQPAGGEFDVELAVFGQVAGGEPLEPTTLFPDHQIVEGLVFLPVNLSTQTAAAESLWIELRIKAAAEQQYTVLSPRQPLLATPRADVALGLAPGAVDTDAIMNGTVSASDIAISAIGFSELADGAVNSAKLAGNVVGANEIGLEAISSSQLAASAIDSSKLAAGAVTANAIAENAIDNLQLAAGSVGASELAPNSVTSAKIAQGAVTGSKIANAAVTGTKIRSGSVGTSEIDSSQVQRRVVGACAVGSMITRVETDGSVACETDSQGIMDFGVPEFFTVSSNNGEGTRQISLGAINTRFCLVNWVQKTDVDGTDEIGSCEILNLGSWTLRATATNDASVLCGAMCLPLIR